MSIWDKISGAQRDFAEKDWRDAWDLETNDWKPDSWYPGRNISRFADIHLGGGDYHMQTTGSNTPDDYNPFLTDVSNYLGAQVSSHMGENFSEEFHNDDLVNMNKHFYSNTSGYPVAEGVNVLKTLYPEEKGNVYGFGENIDENTYLDPYTGDIKYEGTRDSSILDEYGNPVTGREGQVETDKLSTSRWYPGKFLGAIGDMITGKTDWGNPFAANKTFSDSTGEYTQSNQEAREDYMRYKAEHPLYGPYIQTETGYSGGLLNYDALRDDMEGRMDSYLETGSPQPTRKVTVPMVEDYMQTGGLM